MIDINKRLLNIRETAALERTKYAYIFSVVNIFVSSPDFFQEVCEDIGISEERLLEMLENPEFIELKFLDQLLDLIYNKCRKREMKQKK